MGVLQFVVGAGARARVGAQHKRTPQPKAGVIAA
jgi:hypothetical protein